MLSVLQNAYTNHSVLFWCASFWCACELVLVIIVCMHTQTQKRFRERYRPIHAVVQYPTHTAVDLYIKESRKYSALIYPTISCEKGHLHDEAITEDRPNKRAAEDSDTPLHQPQWAFLVAEVEPWQAPTGMLHTSFQRSHSFFENLLGVPKLRRLASKFAIPAEVWQHGTSSLLGFIGGGLPIPLDSTFPLEVTTLCMMAHECNRFEYLGCSPGDEEEHHELSLILRERKERTPCRARGILPNKIWSRSLSSPRIKPKNEATKHCDNEAHNTKLKTQSGRASSKRLSPKGLLLKLFSFLSTLLTAPGHKKRLFTSVLMANIMTGVSGGVIPPKNSEIRTSLTFSNESKPFQSLKDKSIHLLNLSSEAVIALIVIAVCEMIRRIFCRKVQNRLLSATCMAASTSCFAYLRDTEDMTGGLLAGIYFAGAVFTWNTFSMGVKKYNFGTPYIIVGMILGMTILWRGFPYIQPLIGSVKIDVFILPSIILSFSILEMIVKVHDDMIR